MHVFCPDCNAEYKVSERSSLTKTIKFVCFECGNSWVDKFEKLEQTKKLVSVSQDFNKDNIIQSTNNDLGSADLNSLAFEEVQNSFGNNQNRTDLDNNYTESKHIFEFETSEVTNETGEKGPSTTFPKIKSERKSSTNHQIEERDVKEIEIEKRLKESSELLKKAKQPYLENKETTQKENKQKNRKVLVTLSIVLVISFFSYSIVVLFFEDVLREIPFAIEIMSLISHYSTIFKDMLLIIIERITEFIPNSV